MTGPDPSCVVCFGLATQDYIFLVDRIPDRGTKFRARDHRTVGGGTGGSAAVAAARLGGRVHLVWQLGDDALGDTILRDLAAEGVDCGLVHRVRGGRSSASAVIVDAHGERLVLNYADPDSGRSIDWIPDLPAGTDCVLADARWPEASARMLGAARARGIPAVLDGDTPGAPPWLVASATVAAFSAPGLQGTTGTADLAEGLARATAMGDAVMMVTDGANGVLWRDGTELRHIPAFSVAAVDTLGAGDIFHGALALALAEGRRMEAAIVFASGAAALKATRFGGRAGAPGREELETFLSRRLDIT